MQVRVWDETGQNVGWAKAPLWSMTISFVVGVIHGALVQVIFLSLLSPWTMSVLILLHGIVALGVLRVVGLPLWAIENKDNIEEIL